jgi:tripartite-type tricarboxylate transporter receptor subunit TctC
MRRTLCIKGLALLFLLVTATPRAQDYPLKPINVVVPFAAGGANDIQGRIISQKLTEALGQPVRVENRPGAGGNIGADFVAKSAPNGYTLLFVVSSVIVINPFIYDKLPYDSVRDLAPVAMCCEIAQLVVVNPSLGVHSLNEMITLARSKPDALSYGSMGNGSTGHLNMEAFKHLAGIDVMHVPYKGAAPAVTDLISGRISMMIVSYGVTQSYIQTGALRVLAVGSKERSSVLPDVPTVSEAGLAGYEAPEWIGMFAPAATPKEIISKLNAELVKISTSPEFRDRLQKNGLEPARTSTPREFAAFIQSERLRAQLLVKSTGAKVD